MELLSCQVFANAHRQKMGNPVLLVLMNKSELEQWQAILAAVQLLLCHIKNQSLASLSSNVLGLLPLNDRLLLELEKTHTLTACCAVIDILPHNRKTFVNIQCCNASHLISCCGHGSYALSDILFKRFHHLKNIHYSHNAMAKRSDTDGLTELCLPLQGVEEVVKPDFLVSAFSPSTIINVWQSPQKQGYLLMEYASETDLRHVGVNFEAISQYTQRACLIFTRPRDASQQPVHMRYFAPQYGINEDMATASVCRVLASIFPQTDPLLYLLVCQSSALGAEFLIARTAENVLIRGNVKVNYAEQMI